MIAVDMDGTLLNSKKEISDKNREALIYAKEKGVKIVIATGRLYTSAKWYAKLIGVNVSLISCNGAQIREEEFGDVIYFNFLDKEKCYKVLDICQKYDVYYQYFSETTVYTDKRSYSSVRYVKWNEMIPVEERVPIKVVEDNYKNIENLDEGILKFLIISNNYALLNKIRDELAEDNIFELTKSLIDNVEVVNKGVSKGRALEILSGYYNIPKDEIIAIGDNENDLSMIKFAGLGIAMGNSTELIKLNADYITKSNDEDGVASAIYEFIK